MEQRMKILVLSGVKCTKKIWEKIAPFLEHFDTEYIEYSHEVTERIRDVKELTQWVYENCKAKSYEMVIGHSLGGLIALQLCRDYSVSFEKIICLDTNFRPAGEYYRNLMTKANMEQYGPFIQDMFEEESKYYNEKFFEQLHCDFDYTNYINNSTTEIYALYGDRGNPEYDRKIEDLNLEEETLNQLHIRFVENACHMIMIENPEKLETIIKEIIEHGKED